jgi:glyoxylase-like metal-dependent hydrolase (beta-lactamase superfamily II)
MARAWHYEDSRLRVRKMCVGSYENNVFVVACAATGEAVIIDAAAEPERIIAEVADVRPRAILTTHGHFDHVGAARQVADRLQIPFRLHPDDAELAALEPDEPLGEETVVVGELEVRCFTTPGHTAGSVSMQVNGLVFTGDTLFPGGPGATRGQGASFPQIIATIRDRLFTLPGNTLVLPGHGLDTTIATEQPFLDEWARRGW